MNEFETFFNKYMQEKNIPAEQADQYRPIAKAIWEKAYSVGYTDGYLDKV